jgi:pimeloyl-ACP methyl ester carboxylesterase
MSTITRSAGHLERAGIRIAYETAGADGPTVALLPAWAITNRRMWAAQVDRLGRDHRVVTYDGRGSGDSDRPTDPAAYDVSEFVADGFAVLDAIGTDRAVLVGNSLGGLVAYLMAAHRPDRVAGLVLVGPSIDVTGEPSPLQRAMARFDDVLSDAGRGWAHYNRRAWERDFEGFVRWFVDTALGDEATADARAEGIAAGLDVGPAVLAATLARRAAVPAAVQTAYLRGLADHIRCPALVVTGDRDAIVPPPHGAALAWLLGAEHCSLAGAGHCPHVTRPDELADLIAAFVAEVRS